MLTNFQVLLQIFSSILDHFCITLGATHVHCVNVILWLGCVWCTRVCICHVYMYTSLWWNINQWLSWSLMLGEASNSADLRSLKKSLEELRKKKKTIHIYFLLLKRKRTHNFLCPLVDFGDNTCHVWLHPCDSVSNSNAIHLKQVEEVKGLQLSLG